MNAPLSLLKIIGSDANVECNTKFMTYRQDLYEEVIGFLRAHNCSSFRIEGKRDRDSDFYQIRGAPLDLLKGFLPETKGDFLLYTHRGEVAMERNGDRLYVGNCTIDDLLSMINIRVESADEGTQSFAA